MPPMPTLPKNDKGAAWHRAAAGNRAFAEKFDLPRPVKMPWVLPDGRLAIVKTVLPTQGLMVDQESISQANLYVLAHYYEDGPALLIGWCTARELARGQLFHFDVPVRGVHRDYLHPMSKLRLHAGPPSLQWEGDAMAKVSVDGTYLGLVYRIWRGGKYRWVSDASNGIFDNSNDAVMDVLSCL